MARSWRRYGGRTLLAVLGLVLLLGIFLAYQSPSLLLDFLNFNYCG